MFLFSFFIIGFAAALHTFVLTEHSWNHEHASIIYTGYQTVLATFGAGDFFTFTSTDQSTFGDINLIRIVFAAFMKVINVSRCKRCYWTQTLARMSRRSWLQP